MTDFEIIEQHLKKQRHNGRLLHNRRFRLTDKDRQLIRKQLKTYPLEDLLDAITQTHREPWNLGANPNGRKHLRLGLCIDDDHINDRIEAFEKHEAALIEADEKQASKGTENTEIVARSTISDTTAAYREARRRQRH
tara:strand:+ start:2199 stop:2609 length:411 start_codon:yes stop_codon:yes gene_type:complete